MPCPFLEMPRDPRSPHCDGSAASSTIVALASPRQQSEWAVEAERSMRRARFNAGLMIAAVVYAVLLDGCVPIQAISVRPASSGGDDAPPSDGDNSGADNTGDGPNGIPVVSLSLSNPNPQPNEQVLLSCAVVGESDGDVTFDFQPSSGRLFVNERAGSALFIVEESDIGTAFSFTCRATSEQGTSAPSNRQVILPTSP